MLGRVRCICFQWCPNKTVVSWSWNDTEEILGSKYNACSVFSQDTLHTRRLKLSSTFAEKCTKHPRNTDMFKINPRYTHNVASRKLKYLDPMCTWEDYSTVVNNTELLNDTLQHWRTISVSRGSKPKIIINVLIALQSHLINYLECKLCDTYFACK